MALADIPADLIQRCQAGEPGAFDALYERTRDDLYRWIFSLLRNEEDALEVLQETYLRVFRHIGRLKDRDRFGAWAGRIVINQVNSFRVRASRTRLESLEEGLEAEDDSLPIQGGRSASPRAAASRREVLRDVNRAIAELPPRQRTAVLLFDVKGWSLKDIAEHLECSEGAVKFNVFQARRKLRALLGDYVDENGKPNFDSAE